MNSTHKKSYTLPSTAELIELSNCVLQANSASYPQRDGKWNE